MARPNRSGRTGLVHRLGLFGTYRYLANYWTYRGFASPWDPAFVKVRGSTDRFCVASSALAGRRQLVDSYLPPRYTSHPARATPCSTSCTSPGRPAFFTTVRAGVVDDVLVARSPRGGYEALNIGLNDPGEFRVLESWSGYERADDIGAMFRHRAALLAPEQPAADAGASLLTNAIPIVAAVIFSHARMPGGTVGTARFAAFVCVVAGTAALAWRNDDAVEATA